MADGLRVLLEAPGFVVVDKPSGLLSVPGRGEQKQDCVVSRVRGMFERARGPLMVHRLDMDTSGVMVVALDEEHQRALSAQFEGRVTEKRYIALLEGSVERDAGVVDLPMRLDVHHRPWQVVDFRYGKAARTEYRVVTREGGRTRVEFTPVTGRSHQLRVHAVTARVIERLREDGTVVAAWDLPEPARSLAIAAGPPIPEGLVARELPSLPREGGLGAAIVGDPLYGRGITDGERLMLHASRLVFTDPGSGRRVEVESPTPF